MLDRLTGLTRWGLGGRIGDGRQWDSWIHVADWLRVVRDCLGLPGDDGQVPPEWSGVLEVTAPHPVTNRELMAALRSVLGRPPAPPTPVLATRLGAVLLRTDPALALTGRRVVPARLSAAGFRFAHPHLEPALRDLLG